MFIYERYILKKLVVVFVLTVVFFTVFLFVFNIFRIAKHLAAGLQFSLVLRLFVYLVPSLLGFSIPLGTLVACLLVYGKLSAQNEILALRVSGVSLYRTASAMAMLGVATFFLALFVFGVVSPRAKYAVRKLRTELGSINPLFLFEPGETTKIGDYSFSLGKKHGNRLYDLGIVHVSKERVTMWIHAQKGTMTHNPKSGTISLRLEKVDSLMRKRAGSEVWEMPAEVMEIEFDLTKALQKFERKKEEDDMTLRELQARMKIAGDTGEDAAVYQMEFHKRLVFSFACLSFAMIGTPLGMRIRRGEKTVGAAIGIALAMSFYTVVMFAERLKVGSGPYPQILMWSPNAVLVLLGMLFFRKTQRGLR